ncbi:hypothetical protein [Tautonia plasticadhaerens]|uniref:Uncharacterized protein n=1 Tax=Tautonia plasticadhaerens TaxID=2527974 RepID=A0A518H996_9BACT|nr:hypothetical protein [Tautonia plasticadhaerens]QDV37413.1 hypothetical protein ElP_53520 [Tautonia plasticadhaerens]
MIVDECRRLSERIAEKRRLRIHVEQLNRFQRARDLLAGHVSRLAPLVNVCRTLRAAGVGEIRLDSAEECRAAIAELHAKYREGADSILDERTLGMNGVLRRIVALADALEAELRERWASYTAARIPSTNREVLDVLAAAFPREVGRIRLLAEQCERARQALPMTTEDFEAFTNVAKSLRRSWDELGGGELPSSVLDFLRSAASLRGASIELLTDEVRGWLHDHGILNSFSVRLTN